MLTLRSVSTPEQKQLWLGEHSASERTFVVPDLQSKLTLQKTFLQTNDLLEEDAVLRASELWKKLLFTVDPEVRLISVDLTKTLLVEWLKAVDLPWAQTAGAAKTLFAYMQQLLPLLSHPDGKRLLEEWFEQNQQSRLRWQVWFEVGLHFWQRFVALKWLPHTWVPSYLLHNTQGSLVWPKRLVFDLGLEMTSVEAEIIRSLSQHLDVEVWVPTTQWSPYYSASLKSYEVFKEKDEVDFKKKVEFTELAVPESWELKQYTTMLSEVKAVTAQLRQWLDQGVKPTDIAIVAPDIETYWPTLKSYLKVEGIQTDKSEVTTLQTFSETQRWLANLRLRCTDISSTDLEISAFQEHLKPLLPFYEFKSLFTVLYDNEDLNRHSALMQLYTQERKPEEILNRDAFIVYALRFWPSINRSEVFDAFWRTFLQETPARLELSVRSWLQYCEIFLAKKEHTVSESEAFGVQVLSLHSAEWLKATHVWFMGATEEALKDFEMVGLTLSESLSLTSNLGFYFSRPDKAQMEWMARWFLSKNFSKSVFSVPETDFSGQIQAPSLLWLLSAVHRGRKKNQIDIPTATRWDEMQRAPEKLGHANVERVRQDLGEIPYPQWVVKPSASLSATQLERYAQCPFQFAAERIFNLKELPLLDLDADHMADGRLLHSIVEELTVEPMVFTRTEEELDVIIEGARQKSEFRIADSRLWPQMKKRYVDQAIRFLNFEKKWRENFPQFKIAARELSFDIDLDSTRLRGKIDRIDMDGSSHYAVVDYKRSGKPSHLTGALERGEFQLWLYSWIVEEGKTDLNAGEVEGAFYYSLKDMERKKGFRLKDALGELFSLEEKSRNLLSREEKQKHYTKLKGLIAEIIQKMHNGDFNPEPKDKKDCVQCDWRTVCRAPHLS